MQTKRLYLPRPPPITTTPEFSRVADAAGFSSRQRAYDNEVRGAPHAPSAGLGDLLFTLITDTERGARRRTVAVA